MEDRVSRVDALKEKISSLDFHIGECIRKAKAADKAGNELEAGHFDMLAAAGEQELTNLYRDLADATYEEAMASRRDYMRDQSWTKQG
jgi:hypothetical protein